MSKVYLITNIINGKCYVGKTSQSLEARFKNHLWRGKTDAKTARKCYLHRAISKYGEENFTIIELEKFETEEDAYKAETRWIELLKTNEMEFGYNLNMGGKGGTSPSKETREKISNSNKGKIVSQETRDKISNSHKGKVASPETKAKLSIARSGKNNPNYGKMASPETIEKMSLASKKNWENNANKGKISHYGEGTPNSKLNTKQVLEIRELANNGKTHKEIGKLYGVCRQSIGHIVNRKSWKSIP